MTSKKYSGYLLIANPGNPDDELARSVMLVINHNSTTAVALQINNIAEDISLMAVGNNLGIDFPFYDNLYYGGNINPNKINIVHSSDWAGFSTINLNEHISVTNDVSVLTAIAEDLGPKYYRACAGYWLWENGRLDNQLDPRSREEPWKWEIAPATVSTVFSGSGYEQWQECLAKSARFQVSEWF
jgi:putative transcriptional regulator